MKSFIKVNEGFVCKNCGFTVPPAKKTCRNHCTKCLYSLHVDVNPGDRQEGCKGLMEPIKYEQENGETIIVHKCTMCGVIKRNKAAPDDDFDQILMLTNY
jgi:predicted RNA-binding Zn-ribbon protein involved in translation (DUF1610 family)